MPRNVLVVEDEPKLRQVIRTHLEREGMVVRTTGLGAEALDWMGREEFDLVVMDIGLPDVSGLDITHEIRMTSDVSILMLTAYSDDENRIRGLEEGADDYVSKPFSPRELVLRVHALLRRRRGRIGESARRSYGNGVLVVDEDRHELLVRGQLVHLSLTEWGILLELLRQPGRVCSRYELVNAVRGYEWEGYERVVDSHIKNIRRKVDDHVTHDTLIDTVLGVGYRVGLERDRESP